LKTQRILLIDQLNLFFRSYIANPTLSLNGQPIGGLIGSVKSLQKICRETKPDKIVICWDGEGGSKKRKLMKKDYKAGRKPLRLNRDIRNLTESEEKSNKIWQLQRIVEYYNCMPVIQLIFSGIEADDIIAYVANMPEYKNDEKIIISSDKDFFQLLTNKTILYRPIQKQILNRNSIVEKFSIHPKNFAVARAMAGDRSDNLEGIGGAGLKKISKRFPFLLEEKSATITDIVEYSKQQLQENNLKVYQNVVDKRDILERNYQMMQLYTPSLNINAKKTIRDVMENADITFNKTGVVKMMSEDGFNELQWHELQACFRRIVLDNK